MLEESKLITKRMKYILNLLEENVVNSGTEQNPIWVSVPMTIEQISDIGTKTLDEKGMCNQYTYNQVGASAYALFRRGLIDVENIPNPANPTVYGKDTTIKLKEIKIQ